MMSKKTSTALLGLVQSVSASPPPTPTMAAPEHDGPSDEEASSSQPSQQPLYSKMSYEDDNDGVQEDEQSYEDDGESEEEEDVINQVASPPPPPPPPPPRSRSNRNHRRGDSRSSRDMPSPKYPTTIEVVGPRSRIASRAKQKVHNNGSYEAGESRGEGMGAGVGSPGNYESFGGAPSVNNSLLESSYDGTATNNDNYSLGQQSKKSLPPSNKKSAVRGQVLVHYHPQLGDEGYESTLLENQPSHEHADRYSHVSRAMSTATSRDTPTKNGPPKNIYSNNNRGMHTRMIDDLREEEQLNDYGGMNGSPGRLGNDEYNNAATRQIRRRVLRVALERGMHDERRKKMLDADADVGGPSLKQDASKKGLGTIDTTGSASKAVSPLGLGSPGASSLNQNHYHKSNGFIFKTNDGDSSTQNEGDMPFSPRTPGSHSNMKRLQEYGTTGSKGGASSIEELKSRSSVPPPPKSKPPSYRTIVENLIRDNEPENLAQISRVMEKYEGREEELIKKLDLRYRRRRAKKEMILEDLRSIERTRSKESHSVGAKSEPSVANKSQPPIEQVQGPPSIEKNDTGIGSKPSTIEVERTKDKPLSALEMEGMTSPAKITFLKVSSPNNSNVNEEKSAVMAMQSWDKSTGSNKHDGDEIMMAMPPKLHKTELPKAISDSTRTDIHSNANGVEDEDDNSGMVPNIPKVNVQNLGNQVMKERIARGKHREEQIARATTTNKGIIDNDDNAPVPPPPPESPSVRMYEDYKLKSTNSYGDGISVMTMETKSTLLLDRHRVVQRVGGEGGEGEGRYSFDEALKRPPNSIMIESSDASGSRDQNKAPAPAAAAASTPSPKTKMVVNPEILESPEEKARAAETSAKAVSKLDDVEARIKARREMRESMEVARKSREMNVTAAAKETRTSESDKGAESGRGGALMQADDELEDVESLFQDSKSGGSAGEDIQIVGDVTPGVTDMETDNEITPGVDNVAPVIDDTEESFDELAGPVMIASILSSFDEADQDVFVGQPKKVAQPQHGEDTIQEEEEVLQGVPDDEKLPRQTTEMIQPQHQGESTQDNDLPSLETTIDVGVDLVTEEAAKIQDEDEESISHTLSSRKSSKAEKAIADATRSELQRQQEVAAFHHQREVQSVLSGGSADNDNLEEEIARLVAEKESRLEAEKAVALMKAQRELEAERKARLEAEAARIRVEEELQRLRLEKEKPSATQDANSSASSSTPLERLKSEMMTKEQAVQDQLDKLSPEKIAKNEEVIYEATSASREIGVDEDEPAQESTTSAENERMVAELTRLKAEQELERIKLEKMAEEAEAARIKAEQELAKLRLAKLTAKEAEDAANNEKQQAERAERLAQIRAEQQRDTITPQVIESQIIETKAIGNNLERLTSEGQDDQVEIFRQCYSSDDESETKSKTEADESIPAGDVVQNLLDELEDMANEVASGEALRAQAESPATPVGRVESSEDIAKSLLLPDAATNRSLELLSALTPSSERAKTPQESRDEHPFPSTTMQHAPMIPLESGPTTANDAASNKQLEEDAEAQIHHVARVTFEGDRSKGQLSFTTGSKIEAHSNQRGPWWLGRCGGRTGWFPASAVVPASEWLASVNSPSSDIVDENENDLSQLSGEELNAVYDLIRNPSDPLEPVDDDDSDEGSSPAKSRWLDGANNGISQSRSREHSPPPSRLDPSEMAGLTQKLYSDDDDSWSKQSNELSQRSPPVSIATDPQNVDDEVDETLSKDDPSKTQSQTADALEVDPTTLGEATVQEEANTVPEKANAAKSVSPTSIRQGWRAAKDPQSGLIYYYHTKTRETTWKKPPGFEANQPPVQGTPRSSKDKSEGRKAEEKIKGRGLLGFFSKKKKKPTKTAAAAGAMAAVKSPDVSVESKASARKVQQPANDFAGTTQKDTSQQVKDTPQAQTTEQPDAVTEKEHELKVKRERSPQKDFWATLSDDESSVSSHKSDNSDLTESTATSLLSPRGLKALGKNIVGSVGRFAGKINESNRPYEKFGGSDRPQNQNADESPDVQPKDAMVTNTPASEEAYVQDASEPSTKLDVAATAADIEDGHDEVPMTEEAQPTLQFHPDGAAGPDRIESSREVAARNEVTAANDGPSPVSQSAQENPPKDEPIKQKPEWRSAIDGATGRTYYYVKGSSKVTWEKPSDF